MDGFSAFYGQPSVTAAWATRSPWSIFSCSSSFPLTIKGGRKDEKEPELLSKIKTYKEFFFWNTVWLGERSTDLAAQKQGLKD